jgi:hypothetical protein
MTHEATVCVCHSMLYRKKVMSLIIKLLSLDAPWNDKRTLSLMSFRAKPRFSCVNSGS